MGVGVRVMVGVMDAVGVTVGGIIALNTPQPEIMDRLNREQTDATIILKR